MVAGVNPLASLGGFQNQQLHRAVNRAAAPGVKLPGQQSGPTPQREELFNGTRDRASRQHEMYMQALEAQKQRQAAAQQPLTPFQGGGFQGGQGGMTGSYGLLQGASNALAAMNAAYRSQFGQNLAINEGGRSRARQQQLYDLYRAGRGNLAARPGTSLHESGRAIDFGGAIQNANSPQHRWLQQNAGRWGFKWSGKNFSQVEPWHWEWFG